MSNEIIVALVIGLTVGFIVGFLYGGFSFSRFAARRLDEEYEPPRRRSNRD